MASIKVEVGQLAPGMRLAEPVHNASGTTLMPGGIRLTPMFIVRLKKWGVTHVMIEAEGKPAAPAAPNPTSITRRMTAELPTGPEASQFARDIAQEVSAWFVNVKDEPLMLQLRAIAIRKLIAHGETGVLNVMRRSARAAAEEKRTDGT